VCQRNVRGGGASEKGWKRVGGDSTGVGGDHRLESGKTVPKGSMIWCARSKNNRVGPGGSAHGKLHLRSTPKGDFVSSDLLTPENPKGRPGALGKRTVRYDPSRKTLWRQPGESKARIQTSSPLAQNRSEKGGDTQGRETNPQSKEQETSLRQKDQEPPRNKAGRSHWEGKK